MQSHDIVSYNFFFIITFLKIFIGSRFQSTISTCKDTKNLQNLDIDLEYFNASQSFQ